MTKRICELTDDELRGDAMYLNGGNYSMDEIVDEIIRCRNDVDDFQEILADNARLRRSKDVLAARVHHESCSTTDAGTRVADWSLVTCQSCLGAHLDIAALVRQIAVRRDLEAFANAVAHPTLVRSLLERAFVEDWERESHDAAVILTANRKLQEFSPGGRTQSENRLERRGSKTPVTIIELLPSEDSWSVPLIESYSAAIRAALADSKTMSTDDMREFFKSSGLPHYEKAFIEALTKLESERRIVHEIDSEGWSLVR